MRAQPVGALAAPFVIRIRGTVSEPPSSFALFAGDGGRVADYREDAVRKAMYAQEREGVFGPGGSALGL